MRACVKIKTCSAKFLISMRIYVAGASTSSRIAIASKTRSRIKYLNLSRASSSTWSSIRCSRSSSLCYTIRLRRFQTRRTSRISLSKNLSSSSSTSRSRAKRIAFSQSMSRKRPRSGTTIERTPINSLTKRRSWKQRSSSRWIRLRRSYSRWTGSSK